MIFERRFKKRQNTLLTCSLLSFQQHKLKKKSQDVNMMEPHAIAMSKQRKANLEAVVKHAKEDLFPKVKHIYDPKVDLALEGKIFADCKKKCKDQLGGLDQNRDKHMEAVWTDALTKQTQKNALATKRSAVHAAMQNEFSAELDWLASSMTRFASH
jgi:hypothetical protein